jgi:hypothetical protein
MANRANVGQHVVPRCYLKHFGDANGTIYVQETATGRGFASGPDALCKENDIYTLLVGGKRDFSFESINNDIETALGPVLTDLRAGVDLDCEAVQTRVFTHLAAFTANLIARSRVLRKHMDNSLDQINTFLSDHPDFFDDFPETEYQQFLDNPDAFPEVLKRFPGCTKYLGILRAASQQEPAPSGVDETVECLRAVKGFHYQVLLRARTGATADLITEVGAKADLILTDVPRFISADDPVIFLADGALATNVVPTNTRQWTESGRGVYLPLNPHTAILWSADGTYSAKKITVGEISAYNTLVRENAIRHAIASDPTDFTM